MNNNFNELKKYIEYSKVRKFNEEISVRLSKELAIKYDKGSYYNHLERIGFWFKKLKALNILYPGNAHPVLYIYIIPDENYQKLLNFPAIFDKGKGGGKTVPCFDLEGFNSAYAISQNLVEDFINNNIAHDVNTVHELAHVIHSQFFYKNSIICEGFADMVPLYILDLKDQFLEYKKMLASLDIDYVLSAEEIIDSERKGTFGKDDGNNRRMCSFRISYISSFLFVMVCMKLIEKHYKLSKVQAMQKFLTMIRQCNGVNDYLIYEIADSLFVPREELLSGKRLQLNILNDLIKK